MSYYALVASLPALQIGDEPPYSTEEYIERAALWITTRQVSILKRVLLEQVGIAPCELCKAWDNIETQLRNAIARQRAQKLGLDAKTYIKQHDGFSGTIEQWVTDAFTRSDPLEIEEELDRARWQLAEELIADRNPFGFRKVLAYGIQLRIIERWNNLDVHTGKENLDAVIKGNTEEGEQNKEDFSLA